MLSILTDTETYAYTYTQQKDTETFGGDGCITLIEVIVSRVFSYVQIIKLYCTLNMCSFLVYQL